jgi:hypothetical protein
MQHASINLQLAAVDIPKPRIWPAVGGYRPVLLGDRHQFMGKVLTLIDNSPTGSAMLNRLAAFVGGAGFTVNEGQLPALSAFLKKVAGRGKHKTGNRLLKRVAKDYAKLRGVALQVVWAVDGQHIAELYHQRFETVASGPLNDEEEVERFYLCRDWKETNKYKVREIPAFNPAAVIKRNEIGQPVLDEKSQPVLAQPIQLFYFYEDEPGQEYYPKLPYQSGLNYMEAEGLLGEFHPNNVANNFALGSILKVHQGPDDETRPDPGDPENKTITVTREQQQQRFVELLESKFVGPRAKKLLVMFGNGTAKSAEDMAHLESYTAGNSQEFYSELAKLCQQAILSAGQVTSPVVVGIPGEGGLGGNASELVQAFKLYAKSVARPDQLSLLDAFRELFGYVSGVSFEGEPAEAAGLWLDIAIQLPVEFTLSEQTMELIMTDNELRKLIGLAPLPAGTPTAADNAPAAAAPAALPAAA